MKTVNNKLRVLHYPQIPCKPFIVDVYDEWEAHKVYNTISDQHLFLFDGNFIPDYSNAILVQMWDENDDPDENGEKWCDYWNEEEMMEWKEFADEYLTDEKRKSREISDRFAMEEVCKRIYNGDEEYFTILTRDWLAEMVSKFPLTEEERVNFIKDKLGWDEDFIESGYFKNEEQLKKFINQDI